MREGYRALAAPHIAREDTTLRLGKEPGLVFS
jgi:hypothetical protein